MPTARIVEPLDEREERPASVVVTNLRRLTPASPAPRMSRATRFLPTWTPLSQSSAWTRGLPYVPWLAAWIDPMRSTSAASLLARIDGRREAHA